VTGGGRGERAAGTPGTDDPAAHLPTSAPREPAPPPAPGPDGAPRPPWAPPSVGPIAPDGGERDQARLKASLRTLELTVRRRLDGLLQGNHLGLVPGPGTEPGDPRPYQPGDDVRRMDWSVTARTTEPHIRETVADRELETQLVVDLSPSLDFGTASCEKRDLAIAACAAVVHLTRGGGNRVGAVVATGAQTVRLPARGGESGSRELLRRIAGTPRAPEGTRGDLPGALESLRRPPRRRGLVVVVSDFLGEVDWERALRALRARHDLLAVEVVDPRDEDLPDVGTVVLSDPESGHQREVTTTATLRRRFAAEAAAHRDRVAAGLRGAGAAHLVLRTDRDWIADVVRFAVGRKRGWSGGSSTGIIPAPAGVPGSR
jgi:uncharacterized protein (DUF58 family)